MTSLIATVISLVFLLLISSTASSDLIHKTCKKITKNDLRVDHDLCVNALQAAPASRCARLPRLGLIAITSIENNVTDTKCLIKFVMKNKKAMLDKGTKAALKDCLKLYSDLIPTVSEAVRDYNAKRFDDANLKVSSVMGASTTCEQGFDDVDVVSPLTKQNDHASQLSAIALSIMSMLH